MATKKVTDLTVKKFAKLNEMKAIVEQVIAENRSKDEDETKKYDSLAKEVTSIESQIREFEQLDELNKNTGNPIEVRNADTKQSVVLSFRDWMKDSVKKGITSSFTELRDADAMGAISSTTDTGLITKTVNPGVDILRSPGEEFLRKLGVTMLPGLVGNYTMPSMDQDTATFVSELAIAADASMLPASLTLAARRVTHTQRISKEALAQTNPAVYASILQNLVNGVYNAVCNDLFDNIETDAATSVIAVPAAGTTVTLGALVNMEASINGLNIGQGAYVMQPQTKGYLKKTAGLTNQAPIWVNNEVNGYPAFGVPCANAEKIYFGDFSKTVVGQWGGLEIVVDPYSKAMYGEIVLTVVGLFDTGCFNKRGIVWLQDASTY